VGDVSGVSSGEVLIVSGGFLVGEAEGVKLNGLPVWGMSTRSNCERLDVGLVLGADVWSKILEGIGMRLFPGSSVSGSGCFFVKRPELSLGGSLYLLLASVTYSW
jgi:hypothetical protein